MFYWVLLGFTEFYIVSLRFTGLYWVLPSFRVFLAFYLVSDLVFHSLAGFLLGFTGFYIVSLGFNGFYWVIPSFTSSHWVLMGFTGNYRVFGKAYLS